MQANQRIFLKDHAKHTMPWDITASPTIPASFIEKYNTLGMNNPTIIPQAVWESYHFTFIIRNPQDVVPSLYRCTIPPLVHRTRHPRFEPHMLGYKQLRRLFDYLRTQRLIGPGVAGLVPPSSLGSANITLIDSDDLLDDPVYIISTYCAEVGISFYPGLLSWSSAEAQKLADEKFKTHDGWHDRALESTCLQPRTERQVSVTIVVELARGLILTYLDVFRKKG